MFQCFDSIYLNAKARLESFLSSERGDVNIVSIVVLIGIAVILAGVFKEQIKNLLNSLFDTINRTAANTIGG